MANRLTWQRIPAASIRVLHPGRELPFLVAYSLFYIALAGCTAQLILHIPLPLFGSPDFLLDYWYFLFFKITFLLMVPAIAFWSLGYRLGDLDFGSLTARDFVRAAVALTAGFAINLAHLGGIRHQLASGTISHAGIRVTLAVLIALFNAGVPEEFVFRYWLQTRMEQRFGRVMAILGTAVLFTAWHIPSRYFLAFGSEGTAGNLPSVVLNTGVPVFIVALILGLLWDRYRRLLPLIALHWGIDILPLVSGILGIQH